MIIFCFDGVKIAKLLIHIVINIQILRIWMKLVLCTCQSVTSHSYIKEHINTKLRPHAELRCVVFVRLSLLCVHLALLALTE